MTGMVYSSKMTNRDYELIEHTADVGIRVKGGELKELFKNAALAMFDIIAQQRTENTCLPPACRTGRDRQGKHKTEKIKVRQKADSLEELFINWLNELLSLSATKELIFSDFQINKVDKNTLEALAIGEGITNYRVNTEIKAATYHELKLEQTKSGWQAEVILDV